MKIKDADGGGGRDNDGKSKINDLQLWFTSIVSFNSALTKAKMGGGGVIKIYSSIENI